MRDAVGQPLENHANAIPPSTSRAFAARPGTKFGFRSALMMLVGSASGQTIDLVSHNGFEQCWSSSILPAQITGLVTDAVQGAAGCIPASPPSATTAYCTTTTCADGSAGCPITFHAGQTTLQLFDVANRALYLDSAADIDPFSTPITIDGNPCTLNVTSTSDIVIAYPLDYPLIPDGNNGYYTTGLGIGTIEVLGLSSGDYSVTGAYICSLFPLGAQAVEGIISAGVQNSVPALVSPATVGQSLCVQ